MKHVGVLLAINILIVAAYCGVRKIGDWRVLGGVVGVGVGLSALLIAGDRWTRFKVGEVEIEAAVERAEAGTEQIEQFRKEAEHQRNQIDMILRDASAARTEIGNAEKVAKQAQQKSDELERLVKEAEKAQSELREIVGINVLVTRMNYDERQAFDKLLEIFSTGSGSFRRMARDALENASDMPLFVSNPKDNGFDPATASLEAYSMLFAMAKPDVVVSGLVAFSKDARFTKAIRLSFIASTMRDTKSVKVLAAACRLIDEEAHLNKTIVEWKDYQKWWYENQARYSQ